MKELWYPKAERNVVGPMKNRGKYRSKSGGPRGLVVHYDAGAGDPKATIRTGIKNGYNYLTLSRDGKWYQNCPLNGWGYHAGRSIYTKLIDSVSDELVGVEVVSAGLLKSDGNGGHKTYFDKKVSPEEVRVIARSEDNQKKGAYHAYTPAQEKELTEFILWLKRNDPDVFDLDLVVGHDEVCWPRGRKQDPGGALSMTMPEFRWFLKQRFKKG